MIWSKVYSAETPHGLRLFGPNNGAEVLGFTTSGKPCLRGPHEMVERYGDCVAWVTSDLRKLIARPCCEAIYGFSSVARVNAHLLNRLLKVRSEWSRK